MFSFQLWMNGNNLIPYRACAIICMLCLAWSWGSQTVFAQLISGHVSQRGRQVRLPRLCQAVWMCRKRHVSASLPLSSPLEHLSCANQSISEHLHPARPFLLLQYEANVKEPPVGPTIPTEMVILHQDVGWSRIPLDILYHPTSLQGWWLYVTLDSCSAYRFHLWHGGSFLPVQEIRGQILFSSPAKSSTAEKSLSYSVGRVKSPSQTN